MMHVNNKQTATASIARYNVATSLSSVPNKDANALGLFSSCCVNPSDPSLPVSDNSVDGVSGVSPSPSSGIGDSVGGSLPVYTYCSLELSARISHIQREYNMIKLV